MSAITMRDIYQSGQLKMEDDKKLIYLTPSEPIVYVSNSWTYKQMPSINQWFADIETQASMHKAQGSNHLSFTFPENETPDNQFLKEIKARGFELSYLELYAISPEELNFDTALELDVRFVTQLNIEDYLSIHQVFAEPFGDDYVQQSTEIIRNQFLDDNKDRVIAYKGAIPVGILDLIKSENTIEIDGFGVLPEYQRQGIGQAMQSFVAAVANNRTIILVADGEDTAKDMYLNQGYVYISYSYNILKEQLN
ncbi:GNAT family N-acetyltransferase [Staphylococcus sp. 18_1_E_LY]|uniref:GNAT family N-acetyltransferase n=1 Tax=Staphylococcus lloydii TaxID=2781774 RepID=A0A7T1FAH8_9STAP|nr:GNAT family N-acetyltransferase [Staphylococcus lloydii]MBF7020435.1 GNAT family N-acetyltransferase [Staphylococcus lloydii]MBF7028118.1 GNAT family N-acetyltransferase [Staphylococcus lloydii]QPM75781.1 GNAT family N-acetyltransferase [Staphylococcus lloydii]